jgi:predicted ester cyclase
MGGIYDRAGWLAADSAWFPAFEDFSLTVMDQVAEGGKVATRYKLGGTQTGEFFGVVPAGNTAYLTGTSVDRVENGLIVEHWGDLDFSGFLRQLSANPG